MRREQVKRTIGGRYQIINQIGQGGMGVVYRAIDRLSGQMVALKQVTVANTQLQFATHTSITDTSAFRLALAQEFRILASLRHPNIISVLDYGFDEELQPYFTMELAEGAHTIIDAGRGKPIAVQLEFLVQLLQALAYLHRRGIIHRDLKPDNVLVANGQLRVLDFGLALVQRYEDEGGQDTAGTLAYMAPELLLGEPVSKQSDLYAVGIIAYELFAGQHPFNADSPGRLILEILETTADVDTLNLDERIKKVIGRLLAKDPEERFANAGDIIQLYAEATNLQLPLETAVIRESYLQAADFVGRDRELGQLSEALTDALHGKGSAWLVGGESGAGKSRLLDELKTLALVEGALVLRGQAIVEGGAPYLLWRDALRRLCLHTELTPLEVSLLKPLVPDIGKLLEQDVADAPELGPQATRNRLLTMIEDIFRRQTQPVVVLLEDLHWASESLDVLARLSRTVGELPLLIIGSYRDDERPTMPDDLPDMQVLTLERLPKREIVELCTSIVGAIEHQEQVVSLLEHETEGNVFFIIEVLRTLAEEAGQLNRIGSMALPQYVFSGGMKNIIEHRLSRVPENIRPPLELAAIAGRELDLAVLHAAAPEVNLDECLTVYANLTVLEVQEDTWRFTHDKLREGLLAGLSTEERLSLHRQVATAIEQVYPNDPVQTAVLAYHWGEAGDESNEARYSAMAGQQALTNGAYRDAVTFLERALVLARQTATPLQKALLERQLGEAYYGVGQMMESCVHFEKALALLGYTVPATFRSFAFGLLSQVIRQLWQRLNIDILRRQPKSEQPTDVLLAVALTCERLAQANFILNLRRPILYLLLQGLNLAEQAGSVALDEQARFYASMSVGAGYVPLHTLATMYAHRAEMLLQAIEDQDTITWVTIAEGTYLAGRARWVEADAYVDRCMQVARQIGNVRRWEEGVWGSAIHRYYQSLWDATTSFADALFSTGVRQGDLHAQAAALEIQAAVALRTGDSAYGFSLIEKAELISEQIRGKVLVLWSHGILIHLHLRHGDIQMALKYADQNLVTMVQLPATTFFSLDGYVAVVECYLTLWETQPDNLPQKRVGQAIKLLHQFARVFDIGRPCAFLYQGWYDWLAGKPHKAQKSGEKAILEAQQLGMPYYEGLAHYHLGRFLPQSNPKREAHLRRAVAIFEQLKASWDLEQARAALALSSSSNRLIADEQQGSHQIRFGSG